MVLGQNSRGPLLCISCDAESEHLGIVVVGWVVSLVNGSEILLVLEEVLCGQVVVAGLVTRVARWRGLQS